MFHVDSFLIFVATAILKKCATSTARLASILDFARANPQRASLCEILSYDIGPSHQGCIGFRLIGRDRFLRIYMKSLVARLRRVCRTLRAAIKLRF